MSDNPADLFGLVVAVIVLSGLVVALIRLKNRKE